MESWSNIIILILTLAAIIGGQVIKFINKKRARDYDGSIESEEEGYFTSEHSDQTINDDPYSFGKDAQSLESLPDPVSYKSMANERTNTAFDYNKRLRGKNTESSISSKIRQQEMAEEAINNDTSSCAKDVTDEVFDAKKAVIYAEILKTKF